MSAVRMVFGVAFTMATLISVVMVAQFNSWGQFFFTFFKTFQNFVLRFIVQAQSLRLWVQFRGLV